MRKAQLFTITLLAVSIANSQTWNISPFVGGDGVMEVGKHIDFHESANDPNDFSIRLTSSGNKLSSNRPFGIGTSSPEGMFEISNTASSTDMYIRKRIAPTSKQVIGRILFKTNTTNDQFPYSVGHIAGVTANPSGGIRTGDLAFFTAQNNGANVEVMRMDHKGNVGVGITSPEQKVHINAPNSTIQLRLERKGSGTEGITDLGTDGNGFHVWSGGYDGFNNTDMFIGNGGYVGIGLASPNDQLHIKGDNPTLRLSSSTYYGGSGGDINTILSTIKFSNRDDNHNYRSEIRGLLTGNWASHVGLAFTTHEGGQQEERMRIKHNGNVGIGTTNPTEKLEVAGTIYSQEVRVEVAAGTGPDYVFEPTYDLKSLEEIEQYIKAEKHLPEIPSAKEMEANGVQLGEMNMLLLKKIEELTLHAIAQEKRITQLEPYPSLLKEREAKQGELEKRIEELTLHLIEANKTSQQQMAKAKSQDEKIEELTLHAIEQEKQLRKQGDLEEKIEELLKRIEKLENDD